MRKINVKSTIARSAIWGSTSRLLRPFGRSGAVAVIGAGLVAEHVTAHPTGLLARFLRIVNYVLGALFMLAAIGAGFEHAPWITGAAVASVGAGAIVAKFPLPWHGPAGGWRAWLEGEIGT